MKSRGIDEDVYAGVFRLELRQEHRENYVCLGDVVILLDANKNIAENFDLTKYVCIHKRYLVEAKRTDSWSSKNTRAGIQTRFR